MSGPHAGYTAFGRAVQYWKLANRDKFLYRDGGGDYKQYVHAGDVTLWYDAGNTRLLLYCNVLRREYYKGNLTSDTVQYIYNLTSSNAFSAMAFVEGDESNLQNGEGKGSREPTWAWSDWHLEVRDQAQQEWRGY